MWVFGVVLMKLLILDMICYGIVVKGDVIVIVWIVGIMVVKWIGEFILLCYLLGIEVVIVMFEL